jgi:SAM-dependent methyltransferase
MRVLDLGCGKAKSSIFLAREFGVEVWAADLWVSPSENIERIRDADFDKVPSLPPWESFDEGAIGRVIPLRANAHTLPFAANYFDVITAHDCYSYFGTDDLYLNYLAQSSNPADNSASPAPASPKNSPTRCPNISAPSGRTTSIASTAPTGGVATGPAASSRSNWPTVCRTPPKSGPTGNARTPPTTPPKSTSSKQTPAAT